MLCVICLIFVLFFFFKQKTAYEMRISDWSSDVCSSDLRIIAGVETADAGQVFINGREVNGPSTFVEPEARSIGFVFQAPARSRCFQIGRASCRERVCQYV